LKVYLFDSKMARIILFAGLLFLISTGVPRGYVAHDAGQRFRSHLYQQVQVIGHPAVTVQLRFVFLESARDDGIQKMPILVAAEDRLLMIATQGDVVETAGEVNTKGSDHTRTSGCQCRQSASAVASRLAL
jgi:hypothetical protein